MHAETALQSVSFAESQGAVQYMSLEGYCHMDANATMFLVYINVHLLEHLLYYHLAQCDHQAAEKVRASHYY
jgi:hypothetical protein